MMINDVNHNSIVFESIVDGSYLYIERNKKEIIHTVANDNYIFMSHVGRVRSSESIADSHLNV